MSYEAKVGRDYAYESDCPAWKCPHISVHDWREGRRCPEHPCTCPESTDLDQVEEDMAYDARLGDGDRDDPEPTVQDQPEQERVMEPSTEYRGLCLLGGCIMRDGACLNCGALAIHPIRSEGDER